MTAGAAGRENGLRESRSMAGRSTDYGREWLP